MIVGLCGSVVKCRYKSFYIVLTADANSITSLLFRLPLFLCNYFIECEGKCRIQCSSDSFWWAASIRLTHSDLEPVKIISNFTAYSPMEENCMNTVQIVLSEWAQECTSVFKQGWGRTALQKIAQLVLFLKSECWETNQGDKSASNLQRGNGTWSF